ncbi:MAG TPA: ABC transporter ATP-binding protein [Solirubrobacterales bacterium]
MNAIEISELQVRRGGNLVLPDLSLTVETGSVTALLGPSGCGKTTLMRTIVGVQITEGGEVRVLGEPAGSPQLRSRVAYVTQAPSVYADLSVRENLGFFARILGAPEERIDRAIEMVSLQELEDRVVRDQSGGQRARVSLATALLGDPDVLILDEPTVGLDPVLRRDLWERFYSLADEGKTLLVSSHVMDEAVNCHQLALMREGRFLAIAPPEEILRRTGADDLTEAFLRLIREEEGAA